MNAFLQNRISIVIPMYNEVDNVVPLLNEIQSLFIRHTQYEIIIVDDYSNDGTYEKLLSQRAGNPQLRIFRHQQNYGQSASIITGVRQAEFDWIVTLDGDGQNDPADIPKLFTALAQQTTDKALVMVAGYRQKREDNFLRKLSTKVANGVRRFLLRDNCPDTGCGLKIFYRKTFLNFPHFNHVHRYFPALIKRAGGQVINVPVHHRARLRGYSKYGVMNRLWVGIIDLLGVAWLMRRPCNPKIEEL